MKRLIPALLTTLLLGCFDYTTIIKMEPNGSGTLTLEIGIPISKEDSITFDDLKQELDTISDWQTLSFAVDTIDTTLKFRMEGRFDSPLVFENPVAAADLLGFNPDSFHFTQKTVSGGNRFHWYKRYTPGEEFEVELKGDFDPDAYTWHEELILPGKIIKHNADEQRNDTLIWERRTMDVHENGLIIEAVWEVAR
jgi:hypothetical protein